MAVKQIKGENFITLVDNKKIFYCHIHEAMDFFKNPPKEGSL